MGKTRLAAGCMGESYDSEGFEGQSPSPVTRIEERGISAARAEVVAAVWCAVRWTEWRGGAAHAHSMRGDVL